MAALAGPVAAADAVGTPTDDELRNLVYRIEGSAGPLQMAQGRWVGKPPAPGAASVPGAQLLAGLIVRGDVDGDGAPDAVVLLQHWTGGSGQFLHVAVVSRRQGRATMVAARRVGDRMQVRDLRIEGRQVVLDVVRAGAADPACCPGELATLAWTLRAGRLQPEPERGASARLTLSVLDGSNWALSQWAHGQPALASPTLELSFAGHEMRGFAGCNRFQAAVAGGETAGALRVSALTTTRMACDAAAMQAEARFISALSAATAFGFSEGQLVLHWAQSHGGGALHFVRR